MHHRECNEPRREQQLVGQRIKYRAQLGSLIRHSRNGSVQTIGQPRDEQYQQRVVVLFVDEQADVYRNKEYPKDRQAVGNIHVHETRCGPVAPAHSGKMNQAS
jgi:hypothetical protein